ncbi:hypothetical protein [Polaribacter sargassicola]|uniref:hypothetical protein n=1 Tax=Polaribacter sargassicola TaxID=2836891 RepID=UPI001F22D6B1|nr:hypothetical protein [Polaribacter sp. DS7-9]MCG1037075.1 hypothetical protein [Polaribacter sp. DS7-9]
MNNYYWTVYKNLERELSDLSNLIHIDDKQLNVYSIKIAELLLRTVVEIESISKTLYFQNGGEKPDDSNLYFDTDCLNLLEKKWQLSKKKVQISGTNFYFSIAENQILTPLKKANQRGTSSSDWQRAYQAVKHNRVKSLTKANLKNLIRSMAALYILNIYNNENNYQLGKEGSGVNFDRNIGSKIFSVKLHISQSVLVGVDYSKKEDFDECIYLLKPTDETRDSFQNKLNDLNNKVLEKTKESLLNKLSVEVKNSNITNQEILNEKIKKLTTEIQTENMLNTARENARDIKNLINNLKYECILNKHQY